MKKTTILNNLKYIFLGTIVAIGLSYVVQAAPSPVGTGNPDAPLNVSSTAQTKSGGLSVLAFNAKQNAQFDGSTFFNGAMLAPGDGGTLSFGGTYNGAARNAGISIRGTFSNTGSIASAPLKNSSSSTVCADENGTVVLCDASTSTPPPPASSVKEFLATGNSNTTWTNVGTCSISHPETLPTSVFYNMWGTIGSCNRYNVQLDFSNVVTNTMGSGFFGVSGALTNSDYYNRSPLYWTVPEAGYYQVDITGNLHIETKITDGTYLFITGVFLRAEKPNDPTQYTEYPISGLSATGVNAYLDGDNCENNTIMHVLGNDKVTNGYWYETNTPSDFVNHSNVQYAMTGSCRYDGGKRKTGNFDNSGGFGLAFHQNIYLNAGDKLYLYEKVAGSGFNPAAFSGSNSDPRDFTISVNQNEMKVHVVKQ